MYIIFILIIQLIVSIDLLASSRNLYNGLPQGALTELLVFGVLYPESSESHVALDEAWRLIFKSSPTSRDDIVRLSRASQDLIKISNTSPNSEGTYSQAALDIIETASASLGNRKLKGHCCRSLMDVLMLPPEEIDLARALLLSEKEDSDLSENHVRNYEAILDWMALLIKAKLPRNPSPDQYINAINDFLFQSLHYRFPAHRKYSKHVEDYSLLGKVIDAHQGVCLGVSLLYGCLAQRLEIPIEFVTPPGHIFLKHGSRNIETTACGIHIDDENYLGIELDALQKRDMKEAIGLSFINSGSTHWQNENYEKAIQDYINAKKFMGEDPLLMCLMAFCYYLKGDSEIGKGILSSLKAKMKALPYQPFSVVEDLLAERADAEALKTIYSVVESQRLEQEKQLKRLEETLARCPKFRAAWMQLGMIWMELQRRDKALEAFNSYHALDQKDPTVEYLLAELSFSRQDFIKAWKHLIKTEELCKHRRDQPQQLKELRSALSAVCACEETW